MRLEPSSGPCAEGGSPAGRDSGWDQGGHYDEYQDRHPRNGSAPCLDDALLRAPLPPSTSRERSTARLGPLPAGALTPRRLPRPGGTELRHVPPHCSRDLGHRHGAGSGHLPRLQPPTCSRSVSGVGLGLSLCGFFTLFTAVSRPQLYCRSSLCDFRLLSVNVSFPSFPLFLAHPRAMGPFLAGGARSMPVTRTRSTGPTVPAFRALHPETLLLLRAARRRELPEVAP